MQQAVHGARSGPRSAGGSAAVDRRGVPRVAGNPGRKYIVVLASAGRGPSERAGIGHV